MFSLLSLALISCGQRRDTALGTLEWDRIAMPAPAAERIVDIRVREGQEVQRGDILLQLDPEQTRARLASAQAAVKQQMAALVELEVGPRTEEIERSRAELAAAQANAVDAEADYRRLSALGPKNYASKSDIDAARAAAAGARAQVRAAQEQLLELERGNRPEDIEQGEASLAQARAEAEAQRVLLEKLTLRAPRSGFIDSIPFKLGDEAPVGASLVVMLVGETPYARVYVPQSIRSRVQVGSSALVTLEGTGGKHNSDFGTFTGRVRMVRNDPSFTPYYALTGDDVARLSYIAEIQLQQNAAHLPAGLPLRAAFVPSSAANPRTADIPRLPPENRSFESENDETGEYKEGGAPYPDTPFPDAEKESLDYFENHK
ncbi:HlyD family secretion protein [Microbulbifer pacificus]|uniref:HlyD family secretion protein n=1 Tax=Microbulbifer pacificus TaxID=407164 RepID=UPI0018F8B415|nr:biotin/lipoyl-binding protein [Microbulbifer pacificus]